MYVHAALRSISLFALVLAALSIPSPARAQDAFEIQVYDAETAPPGGVGVETHVNHFAVGVRESEGPELPTHQVTHVTFEPHVGIARWCEAGFYLQSAVRPDGTLDWAGFKARFKVRVPRRLGPGGLVGLALNQELAFVPARYEADVYGWELRPVIDLRWRRLYLSINPIIEVELAGALAGHPHLEPSAKIAISVSDAFAVGAEYYAALGPIDAIAPAAEQVHRAFAAVDLAFAIGRTKLDLNLAAGYGFAAGERWIAKLIFAIDLDP